MDGGGSPITGRVTRVDPAGFVKVSALGIEEQRVRAIIDFSEPSTAWSRLGHDYRVIVHVGIWKGDRVLTLPVGALFRKADDWATFVVKDGKARIARLTVGHRSSRMAEILSGVSPGDRVVVHPSDKIREGVAITERERN